MNIENIFILPNVIGERSRRRFGNIFIKNPKVTSAQSSLLRNLQDPSLGVYVQYPQESPCRLYSSAATTSKFYSCNGI